MAYLPTVLVDVTCDKIDTRDLIDFPSQSALGTASIPDAGLSPSQVLASIGILIGTIGVMRTLHLIGQNGPRENRNPEAEDKDRRYAQEDEDQCARNRR